MQASDLLNTDTSHQIQRQIRQLVAYAISELEIAQAGGSMPSGAFARFLFDAAQKCPGYDGPGETLPSNQVIVEDGDSVVLPSYNADSPIVLSVVGGKLSAAFPADDRRIIRHGDRMSITVGGATTAGEFNVVHASHHRIDAVSLTVALIATGSRQPIHDLGGESGFMYASVGDNKIQDFKFGTDRAHILRHGNLYLAEGISGVSQLRAQIDAAHVVSFVKEK